MRLCVRVGGDLCHGDRSLHTPRCSYVTVEPCIMCAYALCEMGTRFLCLCRMRAHHAYAVWQGLGECFMGVATTSLVGTVLFLA